MSLRITLLKTLDRTLGKAVAHLFPPAAGSPVPHPRSILVIRPGGIGDAVLLLPVLQEFHRAHPRTRITILAEKRNAAVFRLCTCVDSVFVYDRPAALLAVRRYHYDVVVDTEQWHYLSAVIARSIRCSQSIGFATNSRQRLFSHPVPYSHDHHETESFFRLFHLLLPERGTVVPPYLSISEEAGRKASVLLEAVLPNPFVAIFPGASIPEKCWDLGKFTRVAAELHRRGMAIVVVGGRGEISLGNEIIRTVPGVNLCGRTTLAEAAAVVARSSLLISGDSGLLHIGAALGVPTVSLFGPSNHHKWGPVGPEHIVLRSAAACSPCSRFGYTPKCTDDVRCMGEIAVEDVVAAVETLQGSIELMMTRKKC